MSDSIIQTVIIVVNTALILVSWFMVYNFWWTKLKCKCCYCGTCGDDTNNNNNQPKSELQELKDAAKKNFPKISKAIYWIGGLYTCIQAPFGFITHILVELSNDYLTSNNVFGLEYLHINPKIVQTLLHDIHPLFFFQIE